LDHIDAQHKCLKVCPDLELTEYDRERGLKYVKNPMGEKYKTKRRVYEEFRKRAEGKLEASKALENEQKAQLSHFQSFSMFSDDRP
jgi:hypothetical protein